MTEKLLLCPFCGGEPRMDMDKPFNTPRWVVSCTKCGGEGGPGRTADEARDLWEGCIGGARDMPGGALLLEDMRSAAAELMDQHRTEKAECNTPTAALLESVARSITEFADRLSRIARDDSGQLIFTMWCVKDRQGPFSLGECAAEAWTRATLLDGRPQLELERAGWRAACARIELLRFVDDRLAEIRPEIPALARAEEERGALQESLGRIGVTPETLVSEIDRDPGKAVDVPAGELKRANEMLQNEQRALTSRVALMQADLHRARTERDQALAAHADMICEVESSQAEMARLRTDLDQAVADRAALLSFAAEMLNEFWEGPDDRSQDLGLKYGLLVPVQRAEPCSKVCACAEAGADFPAECYRYSPAIIAERQRLAEVSKAVKS